VWPVLINHSFRREGVFHERSVGAHDVRPSRRISLICREESEREAKREYNERSVSSRLVEEKRDENVAAACEVNSRNDELISN